MRALNKWFQKPFLIPEFVLIRQAKSGDRDAFGKLYTLYLDKLYRYVFFRVGQNKELAEDITSEIFLKAWKNLDDFKDGSFQAWVYTIARNKVIDFYRTNKNHDKLEETILDDKNNIEDEILNKIEIEEVKKAINNLTQEQQEVIILKFIEDMKNTEISKILNKKEDAIRALQHRAIRQLKEIIREKYER